MAISPEALRSFLEKPIPRPLWVKDRPADELDRLIERVGGYSFQPCIKLRQRQHEAVAFALNNKRSLLFYAMRVGKTLAALEWLRYLRRYMGVEQALIIAHAPIGIDVWLSEAAAHSDLKLIAVRSGPDSVYEFANACGQGDAIVTTWSTLQGAFAEERQVKRGKNKGKNKLYANHDTLRAAAEMFDALVIDEIHLAMHEQSLRWTMANDLKVNCKWRMGLTGTPFGRDPFALWSQVHLIDDGYRLGYVFPFFQEAFGARKFHPFNKSGVEWVFDKEKMPLLTKKLADISLSCTLDEVMDVNVLEGVIRLPMSPQQRNAHNELIKRIIDRKIMGSAERENVFIRLRQIATGFAPYVDEDGEDQIADFPDAAKFVWLEDFISNLGPDIKCVFFHEFIHTGARIEAMFKRRKISFARLYGGTKPQDRFKARDDFQSGAVQHIVANSIAGGTAIDLSAADYLCFFESPTDPIVREQARARPLSRNGRLLIMDDLVGGAVEDKLLAYAAEGQDLQSIFRADPRKFALELQ